MPDARHVIAISGPVGAGKSTLVDGLAAELADSAIVRFDHYETVTQQPIEQVRDWMRDGADLDAIEIPGLAEDLCALKQGRAIVDPATRAAIRPAKYILFETQFGRRHAATGAHIDLLFWVDTPLDVALARKLLQFSRGFDAGAPAAAARWALWLREYLENYLGVVGSLLRMQRDTVAADADLVLDGEGTPRTLQLEAARAIRARFG